jgi:hypothetical protein
MVLHYGRESGRIAPVGGSIGQVARSDGVVDVRARRGITVLTDRLRAARPPRWWQEIAFIAGVYFLYSLVRNAVPSHRGGAFDRARSLLSAERWSHLDVERSLNHFVDHHHWLAYLCNYYYSTLHFAVTIGVLVWLYLKHPLRYRAIRSVLIITNLVALIGFWFISLAPPRMLPGYVDTVIKFHTWGSLASPGLAAKSNQFAAMPSLHIGWSLWCALAIVAFAKRPWVRALGALYPLATVFVIVGTANHFVLDAVGGAITLGIAVLVQRLIAGRPTYQETTIVLPDVVADRDLVTV